MTGIIIFFIILSVVLFLLRLFASKMYDKNNPVSSEELVPSIKEENLVDDSELVAVISAAAKIILDKKIKVKKISFITDSEHSAWSRAGRLNIMSSHSVTHR